MTDTKGTTSLQVVRQRLAAAAALLDDMRTWALAVSKACAETAPEAASAADIAWQRAGAVRDEVVGALRVLGAW